MNVILLGPPGSGKGTQGGLLSQRLDAPRVSTGDLLRAAVRDETPLGRQAQRFMDQGLLVPDEIILGLIEEVLESPEAQSGIIMDGFPRTTRQADAVTRMLETRGAQVDRVVSFDVPDAELARRMTARAAQEARRDDQPEAFHRRLAVYRQQTAPLIAYYRKQGKLQEVAGWGPVEEIAARVAKAVGA